VIDFFVDLFFELRERRVRRQQRKADLVWVAMQAGHRFATKHGSDICARCGAQRRSHFRSRNNFVCTMFKEVDDER
jgi:hypothetical protein